MKNNKKHLHRAVTFLLGFTFLAALVTIVLFVGFNFKKIAVALNLPFDLPASWYSDDSVSDEISLKSFDSSGLTGTAEWFGEYLRWYLVTDFDEFSKTSEIKNDQLIYFGVVSALNSENASVYENDENSNILVPAEEVRSNAALLIDGNITITDKTVGEFTYNAAKMQYSIPPMGLHPDHMSFITDIKNTNSKSTEVTVSFYPYDELAAENNVPAGNPERVMVIKLKKVDDNYKIVSYQKKST